MAEGDLIETFIEECEEHLQTLEEGLLELEKSPDDKALIDNLFRAMHSIKGGAGLVGLSKVNDISHQLENLLEEVRQGVLTPSEEIISILLAGTDLLRQMILEGNFEAKGLEEKIEDLSEKILYFDQDISDTDQDDVVSETESKNKANTDKRYFKLNLKFRKDIFETGTDPLMLLFELSENTNVLESYINISELDNLYQLDPYELKIFWTVFIETELSQAEIEEIFIFVMEDNEIEIDEITGELDRWFDDSKKTGELLLDRGLISKEDIDQALASQKRIGDILAESGKISKGQVETVVSKQKEFRKEQKTNTVRVESDRLENILNDIAELLIAQSRVKEMTSTSDIDRSMQAEIENSFEEVDKIIRRVQEQVMSASMIPISGTFTRMQRMVRDVSREKGKDIELEIEGKDTELDRKIIEQLADPLKHLVRNAIDHGIETPEEREKAGKDPTGTIELNAYHQEGNIIIEIADDGGGIDKEAVLNKAIDRGIVSGDRELDDSEIYNLLFKPGFSTAQEVTDISGRGVGLDVVMSNIKNIRGDIETFSREGEGTKFVIKLPLTLAIIDGMIIQLGEERLVVPLNSILEFVDARKQSIKQVEGKGIIVNLRDEYIPLIKLEDIVDVKAESSDINQGILIIVKDGQKKLALQVDNIIGQEQVVIKNVKRNMGQAEGVAGATILGDGNVSLIVDVPSMFKLARKQTKFNENELY